jgi:hypothetical protein
MHELHGVFRYNLEYIARFCLRKPARRMMATQEAEIRWITFRGQSMYRVQEILSWKYPAQNRAGRVAEVVECLPRNHELLCSNPNTTKQKR